MRFRPNRLSRDIALTAAASLLGYSIVPHTLAQLPEFSCRPNPQGDGWVCVSDDPNQPLPTLRGDSTPSTPKPPADEAPAEDSNPEPELEPEPEAGSESTGQPGAEPQRGDQDQPTAVQQGYREAEFELDWVPRDAMSPAQRGQLADNCCGAFIDPNGASRDPEFDPATSETTFNASQGLNQINENLIAIDGPVVVQQGYRTVQNNQSTSLNRNDDTVLMDGDVVFREPGLLIQGRSAFMNGASNDNRIENAQYVIHEYGAHGSAEAIVYSGDTSLVTIENGEFSRCEPDSPFWRINASSIVLDQANSRGYARDLTLRMGGVPIFYYPFTLPFPLGDGRSSGFLPPSTGNTRTGGFDFELPYYLNLAPNYDATLSPRLISDRGVLVSGEFRYLGESSMNTLNASYLGGDDLFDPALASDITSETPPVEDRWFVGFQHSGRLGRNWSSFVDYSAVSDDDYFFDLGANGLNVVTRTHLNRQGRLSYNADFLRASLNAQRIQLIDPFINQVNINRPFDRLPELNFETGTPLPLGFQISLRGEASAFDRSLDENQLGQNLIDAGALVNGERLVLEPELRWALENPGWFLRATARYVHTDYRLEGQAVQTPEDPGFGIGQYSGDAGLIFERDMRGGYTQTLEPRLFYLFSDYEDQSLIPLFDTAELNFSFYQLFRHDRFSGGDRVGDADQLTAALTTRILDPRGQEVVRASIGQIRYFEDRLVSLANPLQAFRPRYSPVNETSALVGELALGFAQNWRLNLDVQWNEDQQQVDEGSFQLRYQDDSATNRILNIGYRYRLLVNTATFIVPGNIDPRIDQTDVSAAWPITASWALLGRWNYDHANERNLEAFAGVEWRNCCATIRLVGREWVDDNELFVPNVEPNQGVFVQVTLNGLGNLTGGGLSNLLATGIWGFRDTELN